MNIKPLLLKWARERANLSYEELAQKLGMHQKGAIVRAWEEGSEQPTFRQTQAVARVLHIPVGYLFLSAPPVTVLPIADFRVLPETDKGRYSAGLEEVLNDALRKRDWLREWRIEEGASPLQFIGSFRYPSDPKEIARDIRQHLDLPLPTARNVSSWDEHLRLLVRHIEDAGIIVLQSGIVLSDTHRNLSLTEFRGFALSDEYAPLIFINTRDAIAGRIFTLAHELGHLWTGTSGISNPTIEPKILPAMGDVENLCNRVAAELLVPEEAFIPLWSGTPNSLEKAQELAKVFRVSAFVILLRAFELKLMANGELWVLYGEAQQAMRDNDARSGKSGGNFYLNFRTHNGRVLTREVLTAVKQGNLFYKDGARLLNTKPHVLENAIQRFGL